VATGETVLRSLAELTLRERLTLGWGKVRRLYLAHFRPAYVRESLARRRGHCDRTGACCRLMFTCPLLDARPHPVRCTIHSVKPRVCRLFPIDERDLRDRDIVSPMVPCGFTFVPRDRYTTQNGRRALRDAAGRVHVRSIDLPRE
jgi:hypothetical protein